MKKKSKKQKEDHFLRLPDEIIITIFTKLSKTHFKFLCQNVALVSKRFAFLLHHIPTVSISIPWSKFHVLPQSINPLVILEKIVEIHSLHIEFVAEDNTSPNSEPMFFMWKANYNTKSKTFVFLSSTSILDKKEYKGQEQEDNELQIRTTYVQLSGVLVFWCFTDSLLWLLLMNLLIYCHPLLQSIKITDSNKHGMLCIRDQNLCELRNSLINKANANVRRDDINQLQNITKVGLLGYLPVLHLPLSGLVMKGVIISMARVAEEASDDDSGDYDDDILNWDFEDGEELFGEAVTTIFRNHHNILFRY